jgi:hypothetical protein
MHNPNDGTKNKRSPNEVPIKKKTFDVIETVTKNHKNPKPTGFLCFQRHIAKANMAKNNTNESKNPPSEKPTGSNEENE